MFVRAKYTLADGTCLIGYVGIDGPDESLYVLGIFANGKDFSFNRGMRKDAWDEATEMAMEIRLSFEQIFPVKFACPYCFRSGESFFGTMINPYDESSDLVIP